MKNLFIFLAVSLFAVSCSTSEPCSLNEGLSVKGCKSRSGEYFERIKEQYEDLKEKVEG